MIKWILLLFLRGLNYKPMKNSSIDNVIKDKVVSRLLSNGGIKLEVLNNLEPLKIRYKVELHGNFIDFSIEAINNKIEVYFDSTDIKHMSILNEYFEKILLNIQIQENELLSYFYIRTTDN